MREINKNKDLISLDELKEILLYNENTGDFTWKIKSKRRNVGDIAGYFDSQGYLKITIKGIKLRGHRLAWFYFYGAYPDGIIDHIDGNPKNNSIVNLRVGTLSQNQENRKLNSNKKLRFIGVSYHKDSNTYLARIRVNKILNHIGCFKYPEDAYEAYLIAKRKFHSFCTL